MLVAVSGGADSVCLLSLLARSRARLGICLTVGHLNHCLRGAAAEADAALVTRFAESLELPVVVGRSDVRRMARRRAVSLEMAAREARYAFLAETARRCGATVVATAHTAGDQAETVLLKLMRGAGLRGLAGIPRKTTINGTTVVRPLLDVSGAALRDYLRGRGVEWREDASNAEVRFLRNRVRHELLPLIAERFNPGIETALCRTARICAEEDAWLDTLVHGLREACCGADGRLDAGNLRAQPLAARRRIVRSWLVESGVAPEIVDFEVVDRILKLSESGAGSGEAPLKEGGAVVREYGALALRTGASQRGGREVRTRVRLSGETAVPELGLRVAVHVAPGVRRDVWRSIGELPAFASLSRERVGRKALYVRSWIPGDRMRPMGMKGSRKLQDVFVDAKVPLSLRDAAPVFECGGEIVWVPGYRVARGWGVSARDERAVQIDVARME